MDAAIGTIIGVGIILWSMARWRKRNPAVTADEERRKLMMVGFLVALIGFGVVSVSVLLKY